MQGTVRATEQKSVKMVSVLNTVSVLIKLAIENIYLLMSISVQSYFNISSL